MVAVAPSAYYTISADSLHKASAKPSHLEKRMASKKSSSSEEGFSAEQKREAILTAKMTKLAKKTQHIREVCEQQKSIQHQSELRQLDALLNKSEHVYENRRTQQEQKQSVIISHNSKVQLIASREALKRAELSQQQKSEDSMKTFIEEVKSVKGDDSDAKVWTISVDELKVKSAKPSRSVERTIFVGGPTAVESRKGRLSRRSVQIAYQIEIRNQKNEARKLEIAAKHFAKLAQKNETNKIAKSNEAKATIAENEAAFINAVSESLNKKLYLADVRRAAAIEKRAKPVVAKEQRLKHYSFEIDAVHVKSRKPSNLNKLLESRKASDLSSKMVSVQESREAKLEKIRSNAAESNKKVEIISNKLAASRSLQSLETLKKVSNKSRLANSNRESFINSISFKSGMHVASAKRTGGFSKINKRMHRSAALQKKFIEDVAKAIEDSGDFDKTSFVVDVDSLKVKAGKPMYLSKRFAARSA